MNEQLRSNDQAKSRDRVVAKTHPAAREWLPEDPTEMFAVQMPGDPQVMLALVAEEYMRIGYGVDELLRLAADPNYRALHGLYELWGFNGLKERLTAIAARVGVFSTTAIEAESEPCRQEVDVVPLSLPRRDRLSNGRKENV